jgi:hypothetical protein
MRRFLHRHRWVSVLAAALLLLATSVTGISRMTCLEAGHSVLSLGKAVDCCPEEDASAAASVRSACCAFSEVLSEGAEQRVERELVLDVALVALDAAPLLQVVLPAHRTTAPLDFRPPPDEGSVRQARLRRLLI